MWIYALQKYDLWKLIKINIFFQPVMGWKCVSYTSLCHFHEKLFFFFFCSYMLIQEGVTIHIKTRLESVTIITVGVFLYYLCLFEGASLYIRFVY